MKEDKEQLREELLENWYKKHSELKVFITHKGQLEIFEFFWPYYEAKINAAEYFADGESG